MIVQFNKTDYQPRWSPERDRQIDSSVPWTPFFETGSHGSSTQVQSHKTNVCYCLFINIHHWQKLSQTIRNWYIFITYVSKKNKPFCPTIHVLSNHISFHIISYYLIFSSCFNIKCHHVRSCLAAAPTSWPWAAGARPWRSCWRPRCSPATARPSARRATRRWSFEFYLVGGLSYFEICVFFDVPSWKMFGMIT